MNNELLSGISFYLSDVFFAEWKALFIPEHLEKILSTLLQLKCGVYKEKPPPYFSLECTPSITDIYELYFKDLISERQREHPNDINYIKRFANALEEAGLKNILILLGQRLTPGSYIDNKAIPPSREWLIFTASQIFHGRLTVAAREWTKHVGRSKDKFWGEIKGNDEIKNKCSLDVIEKIITNASWWNVFGHFKYQVVYECRLPSGHGARWDMCHHKFIGFVEPFHPKNE